MSEAVTPTSKVEAVNAMLDNIGERPVTSLEGSGRLDVSRAESVLDRTIKKLLKRGWWFNTEEEISLVPDGTGTYNVPDHILDVEITEGPDDANFVVRGSVLYDTKSQADDGFTETLTVTYIVSMDFEELPAPARDYVTSRAAVTFAAGRVGAADVVRFTVDEASEDWRELHRKQLEHENANVSDAPDIQRVLLR